MLIFNIVPKSPSEVLGMEEKMKIRSPRKPSETTSGWFLKVRSGVFCNDHFAMHCIVDILFPGHPCIESATALSDNAVRDVVPSFYVFPGVQFKENPLHGAVPNSYMGRSENGWITTDLFYGWLAKHFVQWILATERPVGQTWQSHRCRGF